MSELTAERLREVLHYDPETGIFTRLIRGKQQPVGTVGTRVGCPDNGYRKACVEGRAYLEHRLAFLYMTGEWPPKWVDHINLIRNNNRWVNLRLSTPGKNQFNRPLGKNSTTGFKGVSKRNNRYRSALMVRFRTIHLGYFATPEEAHAAYCEGAKKYFGEFANPG